MMMVIYFVFVLNCSFVICCFFLFNIGKPDLLIIFNPEAIQSKGRKAIGDFLLKLQIYKSLGDYRSAIQMFDHYSTVSDDLEYPYLKFRDISLARKKPRRLFVEAATSIATSVDNNGSVRLHQFDNTHEGLIQSFQEHFSGVEANVEEILVDLWKKDFIYFSTDN